MELTRKQIRENRKKEWEKLLNKKKGQDKEYQRQKQIIDNAKKHNNNKQQKYKDALDKYYWQLVKISNKKDCFERNKKQIIKRSIFNIITAFIFLGLLSVLTALLVIGLFNIIIFVFILPLYFFLPKTVKSLITAIKDLTKALKSKYIKPNEPIKPETDSKLIEIPEINPPIPIIVSNHFEEYKPPERKIMPLGSARIADIHDLEAANMLICNNELPNHLILAKLEKYFGYQEWLIAPQTKGHIITVGNTGSGKGVSVVIPNLLSYKGSVVCLDVKGENACITGYERSKFSNIFIFNPYKVQKLPNTCFNPFDMIIDQPENKQINFAQMLSEKMIYEYGTHQDSHWINASRSLLTALILYVANSKLFEKEQRNLETVFNLLCSDCEEQTELFNDMQNFEGLNGIVKRQGAVMKGRSESDRSGVLSTAQDQLDFLNDMDIIKSTRKTDQGFSMSTLRQDESSTLYIVIPPNKMGAGNKWIRIIFGCCLSEMINNEHVPKQNVLFMLDEFPTLGYMKEIADSFDIMRGYGVTLWAIIQNFAQLEHLYKVNYKTILSNACFLQCIGVTDYDTAKHLSDLSGQTTIEYITKTMNQTQNMTKGKNTSYTDSKNVSQAISDSKTIGLTWGVSDVEGGNKTTTKSQSENIQTGTTKTEGSGSSTTKGDTESTTTGETKGITSHLKERNVLLPDDILRMPKNKQYIRVQDTPIILAPKITYYEDKHFKELASKNPLMR